MLVSRPRVTPEQGSATCETTDAVGDLVYVKAGAGFLTVEKVDITDGVKLPSVGIIVSKDSPTSCLVQFGGQVGGVYTTLTPGAVHYAGIDSRPTPTVPAPSGPFPKVYVQPVGVAIAADTLLLQPYPHATARVL